MMEKPMRLHVEPPPQNPTVSPYVEDASSLWPFNFDHWIRLFSSYLQHTCLTKSSSPLKKHNKQRDCLHKASHLIAGSLAERAVAIGDLSQRQMVLRNRSTKPPKKDGSGTYATAWCIMIGDSLPDLGHTLNSECGVLHECAVINTFSYVLKGRKVCLLIYAH